MTSWRHWLVLHGSALAGQVTKLRGLLPSVPGRGGSPRAAEFGLPFTQLRGAGRDLDQASRDLEAQFLATGAELEELNRFSHQFVEQVEKLVRLATGKEGDGALFGGAVRMIEQSIHFLVCCQEQTTEVLERLRDAKAQIQELLGVEAELQRTIGPLKFVQTLFKSESAPLGPAVQQRFDALTQEMETLHGQVRDIFGTKFQHLAQTHETIGQVIAALDTQARSLGQITTTHKARIEATLDTLRSEAAANRDRDVRLGRLSQEIAREVVQVVMGLQFQDIINQKLQHVSVGLSPLEARFAQISAAPRGTAVGEPLRFLEQSARLLAKQLEVAGEELARAEATIQSSIRNVLTHLIEMDSECLSLEEFKLLTTSFDGMVQVLLETIAEVRALVLATVAGATDAFELLQPLGCLASDLTPIVRGVSAHIRLLGLNAQVQAAHAARDTRGAGLEVLSARTSEISAETNRISEQAALQLDAVAAGLAASVQAFARLRAEGGAQKEMLEAQGRAEERQLHAFRDLALTTLEDMGRSFADIRNQADKALATVHFEAFREVTIPGLRRPLQAIAETSERWLKNEKGVTREPNLVADFQRDYTMASERQVFAEIVSAGSPEGPTASSSEPDADSLVEWFTDASANPAAALGASGQAPVARSSVAAVLTPAAGQDPGANLELF